MPDELEPRALPHDAFDGVAEERLAVGDEDADRKRADRLGGGTRHVSRLAS
jgi:hypothetical protein